MESKNSAGVHKIKKCFRCGEEIPDGAEITVRDGGKGRLLVFCSEQCRSIQRTTVRARNYKGNNGKHYSKFPRVRKANADLSNANIGFEKFIREFKGE